MQSAHQRPTLTVDSSFAVGCIATVQDQIRGLLYRGSRDGFLLCDLLTHCAGRSGTLILVSTQRTRFTHLARFRGCLPESLASRADDSVRVHVFALVLLLQIKVKGNNYLFGAYNHFSWPVDGGTVADPTGKSFLFSLLNANGKAVRFNLRDNYRAIRLCSGIHFGPAKFKDGKTTLCTNIALMSNGRAADERAANTAVSWEENADGECEADDADLEFLVGQKFFAAAEIEVYQL